MSSPCTASSEDPRRRVIEATAATWLSLRDRGLNPSETAEFVRWLQLDARHATTFAELDRAWRTFDRLAVLQPTVPQHPPNADLLAPRARPSRPVRVPTWAAACAAAALVILSVQIGLAPRHTAETGIGTLQKLDLPDGSVALLNTDTAVDTDFDQTERRVRIVRGEVFFTVAKDASRPFIVTVDTVAVRAVGTAFNIHRSEHDVEVLVAEGQIQLSPTAQVGSLREPLRPEAGGATDLVAGQRVVIRVGAPAVNGHGLDIGPVSPLEPAAIRRKLAWQERRLEFDGAPLQEIVREFNRYNRVRLVVSDPDLAVRRFSGVFRADGQHSFVRLLEQDFGISVTRRSDEIDLRSTARH